MEDKVGDNASLFPIVYCTQHVRYTSYLLSEKGACTHSHILLTLKRGNSSSILTFKPL